LKECQLGVYVDMVPQDVFFLKENFLYCSHGS
jgi:hypothetical protein